MSGPTRIIAPNQSDSHQAVNNYVITFVPFKYKEVYYKQKTLTEALEVNKPVVVVSDATQIRIHGHKGSPIIQAEINLMSFNVNYSAVLAPGDYVFINLLNNVEDFNRVSQAALSQRPINGPKDGLKFFGRVFSIRQVMQVDPSSGRQIYRYQIQCAGFHEFMTQVYYNPFLSPVEKNSPNPTLQFYASISEQMGALYRDTSSPGKRLNLERLLTFFIDVVLGTGIKSPNKSNDKIVTSPNAAFLIPGIIRRYFGLPAEKSDQAVSFQYADLIYRILGIQSFSDKFYPNIKQVVRKNYYMCEPLHGSMLPPSPNFNGVPLWQILLRCANPALNECYTALKLTPTDPNNPNSVKILPQFITRQIPLTSKYLEGKYKSGTDVTFFLNLPRWQISDKFPIFQYNIGTSEAERFNFIQTYTDVVGQNPDVALQVQIASGNYLFDQMDVARSGTRINITHSNADVFVEEGGKMNVSDINKWAQVIGDFYVNGHLKMNGTIVTAGIQEPIWYGDNLVFDNKIFHIEGFSHDFTVDPYSGRKNWHTSLHLSHGYYLTNKGTAYMHDMAYDPQMQNDNLLPQRTGHEVYVGDVLQTVTADTSELKNAEQSEQKGSKINQLQKQTQKLIGKASNELVQKITKKIKK